MDNPNIDIAELNQALAKSYIHYDPNRIDYSINVFELELLEKTGGSVWKDVFLACTAVCIPCLINALVAYNSPGTRTTLSLNLFLNLLFGILGLILAIISLIIWQRNKSNFKKIIEKIRNKPRFTMPH